MMKDYKTPAGNTKPITFRINGTPFKCRPTFKGSQLQEIFTPLLGDNGQVAFDPHLKGFFSKVMEQSEFSRFVDYCDDADNIVRVELVFEIAKDIFSEYSGAPFDEQLSSLMQLVSAGVSSTDDSPSPAETSGS